MIIWRQRIQKVRGDRDWAVRLEGRVGQNAQLEESNEKKSPENANVTTLVLSAGGAHLLKRACAAGNVTPYIK